jgi:hypothetical protein
VNNLIFWGLLVSGVPLRKLLLSCVRTSLMFLGLVIAACPRANTSVPHTLIIPDTTEAFRIHQSYFTSLLRKALVKGADGRPVPLLLEQPVMDQGRATTELIRGRLMDVYWMGTNKQREKDLRAIRIPLVRGLLGFRRFVIHKNQQTVFDKVNNLADLKALKACQALDWPDTAIMRTAGLQVRELANIEIIYKHLSKGTCDYFPRGYFEVESEVAERADLYPDLMIHDQLVLHYPFAIYFFVSPDNEILALWLERGLNRMIDSGELLVFMKKHPLTASLFPLARPGLRIIHIPNPEMEGNTEYENARYWVQPKEFIIRKKQ